MDSNIKSEWVACLRDGSYKQGKFLLRSVDDHFDVVGVLVDRAVQAGVLPAGRRWDIEGGFQGHTFESGAYKTATRLPKAVEEWSGAGYWLCNRLQEMNDKGKSFEFLADYIESNM